MRILIVNWLDPASPRAGGAERHLEEVATRLASRNHAVTLLTSGWAGAAPDASSLGVRRIRVGTWWNFPFRWHAALALAGGEQAFDIIVEDLNKIPVGAGRHQRRRAVLLVHHLWHGTAFRAAPWPVALVTWLSERGLAWTYRGYRAITVSECGRRDLLRTGFAPQRVDVVYNGVVRANEGPAAPAERDPTPLFLYVGRLQRYKRVHLLLDAMGDLRDEGTAARAIIAGEGPDRARLERLRDRRQLGDHVAFVGRVTDAERKQLYRRSWAHVQPSEREGWGLTVMEAAAEGTCSVAASSPGLLESVVHLETGLLVPQRHLPTFADALRYICLHPGEAWRLGQAAFTRAAAFTWDAATDAIEGILAEVVAASR